MTPTLGTAPQSDFPLTSRINKPLLLTDVSQTSDRFKLLDNLLKLVYVAQLCSS